MEISSFGLRQIAYAYCQFVLAHFGGIDRYQLALFTVLLTFLCGVAFLTNEPARPNVGRLVPPWLYGLLLVVALFLIRLPTFLAGELNVDESMHLAGALKLRYDPVFWRDLDGTTNGPLNFYPLTFLNILGFPLDYGTAHFLNVICMGGTIAVVYGIARLYMDDWIARLAPLPLLAAAMGFRDASFLHNTSEGVSVLLIALATWLLLVDIAHQPNRLREIGIGVLAVCIPLAKLQAGPVAAVIAGAGAAHVLLRRPESKWQRSVYITAGLAGGLILFLLWLVAFGALQAFWQSYIVANLSYANGTPALPFKDMVLFLTTNVNVMWYERGIIAFLFCALCAAYYFGWRREGVRAFFRQLQLTFSPEDLFVLLLLVAGIYVIYRAHHSSPHYLMFLLVPLSLLGIRALAHLVAIAQARRGPHSRLTVVRAASLFAVVAVALPGLVRGREAALGFNSEGRMASRPVEIECAPCQVTGYFAKPGERVAVWGWNPKLYVLTQTVPAIRDPVDFWQLAGPSPLEQPFRRRFMQDLRQHPPQVFLDAVGPGEYTFQDRRVDGYETFPELRDYVNSNFDLVGDIDGVRVFARKGTQRQVTVPFRMNSGGGSVSDEAGKAWNADAYFSNSQTRRFQPDAAIGKLPALYQSERICARECRYLIPIQNGSYLVRMFFAERDYAGANQRVFNVAVDDDALGLDIDIYRAAGGAGKPYVLELPTTVSDGLLDVSLIPRLKEAEINGIEIVSAPETAPAAFQVENVPENRAGPSVETVTWEAGQGWSRRSAKNGHASPVTWRSTGDHNWEGLLASGALPRSLSGCLVAPVAHGSSGYGLSVALFDVQTGRRIGAIPLTSNQEGWQFYEVHYDPAATVRLVAEDRGGDWLGVRDPRSCR